MNLVDLLTSPELRQALLEAFSATVHSAANEVWMGHPQAAIGSGIVAFLAIFVVFVAVVEPVVALVSDRQQASRSWRAKMERAAGMALIVATAVSWIAGTFR
jgi:hypothetical protein